MARPRYNKAAHGTLDYGIAAPLFKTGTNAIAGIRSLGTSLTHPEPSVPPPRPTMPPLQAKDPLQAARTPPTTAVAPRPPAKSGYNKVTR